ncbi:UPF0104 family protein [Pleurocapsales cyanobacterium LEGE 10410]|nr:UPF0104 family protein [Pleurocapsales cyanobacterium LEGE 10410]
MNRDRLTRWLYPTLGFSLLVFSLYILNRELGRYNLRDILDSLSLIGDRQLFLAAGFTIFDYLTISTYDLIAFLQFNYYLKIKRILFTTFLTYAISNTTGFTLLIGGGIRYRFYTLWGVPPKTIAKITALGNLTFWLGLFTLCGVTFIVKPLQLPKTLNLNILNLRYLGIIALILVAIYLYFSWSRKSIRIWKKVFLFPQIATSLSQIVIFSFDWALSAAVLYCLLPDYPNKSYFNFFGLYLIAMALSILSSIPGGIGVFETIIVFLLPKSLTVPAVLSSLVIYRAVRFLLPLGIALILIGMFEIKRKLKNNQER